MRISKEPEVRKQEIIETAMQVFATKGYEATTMKDIAKEMNVASGLCYHYFQNKESLYELAVAQYAKTCSHMFIAILKQTELSLDQCFNKLGAVWNQAEQDGSYKFARFFHQAGNERFHRELDLAMIQEVLPILTAYLEALHRRGEIRISDIPSAALFILNGQMALLNDQEKTIAQRIELIQELVMKILR